MEVNMTKIMLVEDDKSLREIYGVRLLAEGYEITSAGDGEEALAMAVKEHPDLILSDVMMPKISGFDMLDILRATPETKEIKVIMMTALSSEDQRTRGESLGADRYLVKSQVGIEDVVRTVHDVLGDNPTLATPVSQTFGQPVPTMTINNSPQPQQTAPVVPPIITSSPSAPVATIPVQTAPQQTQAISMPQPTAPFSSPAPDSLGTQNMSPAQNLVQTQPAQAPTPRQTTITPITRPTPQPVPQATQAPRFNNPFRSINPAQPAPAPAPQPNSIPQPNLVQDISTPPQTTATPLAPSNDIAAMMERELSNLITPQAPQTPPNPNQNGPINPPQL